jgi:hypothetical protein
MDISGETISKILVQEKVASKATLLEDTKKYATFHVNELGRNYSSIFKVDKSTMEVLRKYEKGMQRWYHVAFITRFLTNHLVSADDALKDIMDEI